ncbi:MAG: hypothetical protein AAFV96_09980 [Pseudomonadota bacterium]
MTARPKFDFSRRPLRLPYCHIPIAIALAFAWQVVRISPSG